MRSNIDNSRDEVIAHRQARLKGLRERCANIWQQLYPEERDMIESIIPELRGSGRMALCLARIRQELANLD